MNTMDEMGMDFLQWVTVPMCDRTVTTEVSGDFTLPDYQPELRRLLSVVPTVLPPAKYVGSGRVELNGTVDYLVLYACRCQRSIARRRPWSRWTRWI